MTTQPSQELAEAVALTVVEGSARFEVISLHESAPVSLELGPGEEQLAELGRGGRIAARAASVAFGALLIGVFWLASLVPRRRHKVPQGNVSFATDTYVREVSGHDRLAVAGRRFVGWPGQWFELPTRPAGPGSPFWSLELVRSMTDARLLGSERVRGVTCRHYFGTSDFTQAISHRSMTPPDGVPTEELRRLPVEVWLDKKGRIRRVQQIDQRTHPEDDDLGRGATDRSQIEFFDFGVPVDLKLPAPSELTDTDPRR